MRTAAVALATVLALATAARAQAPGMSELPPGTILAQPPGLAPLPPPPPEAPTVTRTYRSQVVLADVAALGIAVAAARGDGSGSEVGVRIGSAIWLFGAPAIHFANGNSRSGWKSLGLRAALPMVGAVVGLAAGARGTTCETDHCDGGLAPLGGMILGGAAGMVSAMVIDWAFLAKRSERVESTGWAPAVAVTPTGVSLGAQGRF